MRDKKRSDTLLRALLGLVVSAIWLFPFYLIIVNSVKTRSEIFINTLFFPDAATSENYPLAFGDLNYLRSLLNSFLVTSLSILLIVIFSSLAAYALSRNKSKTSTAIYFLCAITMLIPFHSIMIPLVSIFGDLDLLNRFGLIFMNFGFSLSLSVFLYFGSLRSIPQSLDEAALIDGASPFQIFWSIIFPMLKPTTVTVIILNSIRIWNDYLLPSLVINSEELFTIPLQMVYFFGQYTTQWNLALAGLVLAIIPIIILYIFLQRHIIEGITAGATK